MRNIITRAATAPIAIHITIGLLSPVFVLFDFLDFLLDTVSVSFFFFLVVGSSSSSSVELSAASSFTMFVKVMLPSVFCRDISTLPSPLISYAKLSKFRALPFASVSSTINVVLDSFASIGTVILTVSFCFNYTT